MFPLSARECTHLPENDLFAGGSRREEDEEGNQIKNVVGNKGLNFGKVRYDYQNGYFPTLKTSYSANLYWGSGNLNINQKKIPIPNRVAEFSADDEISIAESIASAETLSLLNAKELPNVYVYAVDVDKINIEFEEISPSTKIKITSNNETIMPLSNIEKQVYTLSYDFNTDLTITISNLDYTYQKEITKENVQNTLDIIQDEYLYLHENTVSSNKRTIDGEFVNIYNGKMLDVNGNIYDTKTMEKIGENNSINILETPVAITESSVDGNTIKTYAHSTEIVQEDGTSNFKQKQIFIKSGYMYVIDGNLNSKDGAAIIDSYNSKQYETILGTDGIMYDLLTKINYPSNFKNKDIVSITSNSYNKGNVVLVKYSNGKVIGFNYITGEIVYDNNVKDENVNFVSYIIDNLKATNVTYNIQKSDYTTAKALEAKLDKVSIEEATKKIDNREDMQIDINAGSDNENNNSTSNEKINSTVENEANASSGTSNSESSTANGNSTSKVSSNKYVTTYDAKTQSYVVYSTAELIKGKSPNVQTENEKINSNKDLISYYTNLSTGTSKLTDTGIVIIAVIIGSICITMVILYKKTIGK